MTFQTTYSPEKKQEAVNYYFVYGKSSKVSKLTGIPARTIRSWVHQEWWQDMLSDLKVRLQDKLDGKMTSLIDDMMTELRKRVEQGDDVVGKDGVIMKKGMNGRDLAASIALIMDRRATIRGDPARITKSVTLEDKFGNLEKKMKSTIKQVAEEETHVTH